MNGNFLWIIDIFRRSQSFRVGLIPNFYIIQIFQCNPGTGMKVLFQHLSNEPKKLMILGSSCSPVTEPMAQTSREFDLVQVWQYCKFTPSKC